jgi:hypothetical protein
MPKKWIPVIILTAITMGASSYWWYSRPYDAAKLMQMLPPDRAVHVYLNVAAMRQVGILDTIAGSKQVEDSDYKKFVQDTGFDYRNDLDSLAIAFRDGDVYYAAQGRFRWEKLAAYAPAHGGKCDQFLCTTPGSEPGRNVSYYMPRTNTLALATSRTATAGDMVGPGTWAQTPVIGDAGLWVSAPPFAFSDLSKMPTGTRSFFSPLAKAQSTTFTLGPAAKGQGFELRMQVRTPSEEAAKNMATQYQEITSLFVKMLERENMHANPSDLSGVLVGGKFESKDKEVTGTWPISKGFVETLAANVDVGGKDEKK